MELCMITDLRLTAPVSRHMERKEALEGGVRCQF